jgi:hypothetical protein
MILDLYTMRRQKEKCHLSWRSYCVKVSKWYSKKYAPDLSIIQPIEQAIYVKGL